MITMEQGRTEKLRKALPIHNLQGLRKCRRHVTRFNDQGFTPYNVERHEARPFLKPRALGLGDCRGGGLHAPVIRPAAAQRQRHRKRVRSLSIYHPLEAAWSDLHVPTAR